MDAGHHITTRVAGHGVAPVVDAHVPARHDVARIVHGMAAGYDIAARMAGPVAVGAMRQGTGRNKSGDKEDDHFFHQAV